MSVLLPLSHQMLSISPSEGVGVCSNCVSTLNAEMFERSPDECWWRIQMCNLRVRFCPATFFHPKTSKTKRREHELPHIPLNTFIIILRYKFYVFVFLWWCAKSCCIIMLEHKVSKMCGLCFVEFQKENSCVVKVSDVAEKRKNATQDCCISGNHSSCCSDCSRWDTHTHCVWKKNPQQTHAISTACFSFLLSISLQEKKTDFVFCYFDQHSKKPHFLNVSVYIKEIIKALGWGKIVFWLQRREKLTNSKVKILQKQLVK